MKYILIILFVYIAIPLYSQENESVECVMNDYVEYPGGYKALRCFLEKNLNSTILNSTGEKGKVMVELLINSSGKIKSIKCNPDNLPSKKLIKNKRIEKEIIRVMNMMPKWKFSGNSNYKRQIFIVITIQIPFYKTKKVKQ